MLLEEQRYIHEDLERLEQGIADRMGDEPKQIRDRLNRDHEVSQLLDQIQKQSAILLSLYEDKAGERSKEILDISSGDPFKEFNVQYNKIKEHHGNYPSEQAENSEQWYKPRKGPDQPYIVESMFSGEEAYGRYFDLHTCHEAYLNLPNAKRLAYLQYLEVFDDFQPGKGGIKRADKLTDDYFKYLGDLASYLESFMRRTRPLENLDKVYEGWEKEFETAWEKDEVPGWQKEAAAAKKNAMSRNLSTSEAVWCEACEKEFKNENVYKGHLNGRKHIKAAEILAKWEETAAVGDSHAPVALAHRLRERAVAEREFRVRKLTSAMSTEKDDTRVNVERRQGMTERERAQELENFYNMSNTPQNQAPEEEEDNDDDDKIYNPLKLPLAWDGKPIPFWLYRLHGLGQEFPCEICGNFVYRGRRAFDKHFNETNHITNLKRLGIANTYLFRDITSIAEAMRLWEKIQREEKKYHVDDGSVVQMEDAEGNVMPEKVYLDLQKQGLL
ncbi:Putative splicing factor 3A subunit 3 [Podospora comata]|uniref:Splicing factor 3A subunit 3 n=1 Tax=Podospora comata TaxID=48703 RepID=A0ABY6S2P6_PODCO|nr:Putative splicing factor 3A subunit 3 [Podospora comata]